MDRTKYNYSSELEVELVKKNAVLCILVLFILLVIVIGAGFFNKNN